MVRKKIQMIINDRYPNSSFRIYRIKEGEMITSIPIQGNGAAIFFSPYEKVKVLFETSHSAYIYHGEFRGFKPIDGTPYCVFSVLDIEMVSNLRKENRTYVHFPGLQATTDHASPITVLDISESGLRVESTERMVPSTNKHGEVEVFFEENGRVRSVLGGVMWERKGKDGYQYGIQTLDPHATLVAL